MPSSLLCHEGPKEMELTGLVPPHAANTKSLFLRSLSTWLFLTHFFCLPCPWMPKIMFSPKHVVMRFPGTGTPLGRESRRVGALRRLCTPVHQFLPKRDGIFVSFSGGVLWVFLIFQSFLFWLFFLSLAIMWKHESQYISTSTNLKYEHLKLIASLWKMQ